MIAFGTLFIIRLLGIIIIWVILSDINFIYNLLLILKSLTAILTPIPLFSLLIILPLLTIELFPPQSYSFLQSILYFTDSLNHYYAFILIVYLKFTVKLNLYPLVKTSFLIKTTSQPKVFDFEPLLNPNIELMLKFDLLTIIFHQLIFLFISQNQIIDSLFWFVGFADCFRETVCNSKDFCYR